MFPFQSAWRLHKLHTDAYGWQRQAATGKIAGLAENIYAVIWVLWISAEINCTALDQFHISNWPFIEFSFIRSLTFFQAKIWIYSYCAKFLDSETRQNIKLDLQWWLFEEKKIHIQVSSGGWKMFLISRAGWTDANFRSWYSTHHPASVHGYYYGFLWKDCASLYSLDIYFSQRKPQ